MSSSNLPRVHVEKFNLTYEHAGSYRTVDLELIIDLQNIRHKLGRKAAGNDCGKSVDGFVMVRRVTHPVPCQEPVENVGTPSFNRLKTQVKAVPLG